MNLKLVMKPLYPEWQCVVYPEWQCIGLAYPRTRARASASLAAASLVICRPCLRAIRGVQWLLPMWVGGATSQLYRL